MNGRVLIAVTAIITAGLVAIVALACFTQLGPPICPKGLVYVSPSSSAITGCMTPDQAKDFKP